MYGTPRRRGRDREARGTIRFPGSRVIDGFDEERQAESGSRDVLTREPVFTELMNASCAVPPDLIEIQPGPYSTLPIVELR